MKESCLKKKNTALSCNTKWSNIMAKNRPGARARTGELWAMQVVGRRNSHTSRKEPTQAVKEWKFQWRIIVLLLLDVREIVIVVVVGGNKT